MREKEIRRVRTVLEVLIAMVAILIIVGIVGNIESRYTRVGTVTEIEGGYTTIEDTTGNLWAVESTEFATGDSVEFCLFTRGTESIYDDVVESVKLR